ncbi:histidinol-phosphatase [uncultured Bacteroides sp.]|uniref:histidinol-phosphatase n=1 Tax=uncultured Bacteroides sp. TaxID=162156 RepID=UPI002AAB901B|nr:histidinol-phosphatase [uncultured Bacteroides sp.]
MNLTNYHSHTSFCDGRAPMEDFVKEAVRQGFTSYGISSHAPLPFPTHWTMEKEDVAAYLEEFKNLKNEYKDKIELYISLEIDYLDEYNNPSADYFQNLPLDYRIGSVHLLNDDKGEIVDIDCSKENFKEKLEIHFNNDLKATVLTYYSKLMSMVELGGFDIVGHADKIAYNASFCQPGVTEEVWYQKAMKGLLALISEKGCMMEINTKAYHKLGVFYPDVPNFSLIKDLHIPVLVNSDSHYPELVNDGRAEALQALKAAGINTVMELVAGKWKEMPIFI